MSFRVAIISDIHCHHPNVGYADTLLLSDLPARPEKQNPLSSFKKLVKDQDLSVDALLVPGDITNRGDTQGMQTGWGHVGKIASYLKTDVIAATLGNHDVLWKNPGDDAFKLARNLDPEFPSEKHHLNFWADSFYFEELDQCRILVVNSSANHTNDIAAKRGYISLPQLESIDNYLRDAKPKDIQIGLCHHHPVQHEEINLGPTDLMENGSLLVEMLSRHKFSLLVHGHKHHPRLKIDQSGGHPLAILASGSFAASMSAGLGSRTRNTFHIVELKKTTASGGVVGSVHTWQFQHQSGWTKATQEAADFPHLAGFGSLDSPADLANRIDQAFQSIGKDIVYWTELTSRLPELDQVPPFVFRETGKHLLSLGYDLQPAPPDRPKFMGKPA